MPVFLVVCVAVVQCVGLAGLGWAKMSEGSTRQSWAQLLFFATLLVVAATAAGTVAIGSALWPVCSTTCGVMILGATISSRRDLETVL